MASTYMDAFQECADLADRMIKTDGVPADVVVATVCEEFDIVVALIRKPGSTEVASMFPIKGTEIMRAAAHGNRPAPGTYERLGAVYAKNRREAEMLAAIFGDGGVNGPVDPCIREAVRGHIAASETKRAAKMARRAAAARKGQPS